MRVQSAIGRQWAATLAVVGALAFLSSACTQLVDLNPETLPAASSDTDGPEAPFICQVDRDLVLNEINPDLEFLAPNPTYELAWDGSQYVIAREMIPDENLGMGRYNSSVELLWCSLSGEIPRPITLDWCTDHHCAGESEFPGLFVLEDGTVGTVWHDHMTGLPGIYFRLTNQGDAERRIEPPITGPDTQALSASIALYPDPSGRFENPRLGLAYVSGSTIRFKLLELTNDDDLRPVQCNPHEGLFDCRISQSMMGAHHPVLSANQWGFVLAWKDYRHENSELYLVQIRLDLITVQIGPEIRLTYANFDSMWPNLAWNWTLKQQGLVWQDFRDGYHRVFFASLGFDSGEFAFAGGPEALAELALTDVQSSARKPRIAANGPYYGVAWENRIGEDTAASVLFAFLDGTGKLLIEKPLPVAWMTAQGREVRLLPLGESTANGQDSGGPYRFALGWVERSSDPERIVLSEVSCTPQQ